MSRTWWVHRLFGRRPTFAARPTARPRLVGLEDRTVPALQLAFVAAAGALSLTEVSAAPDDVDVTEPVAGQLRVQLNFGATFAPGSALDPALTYEVAGDPAASTFVLVDVAAAPLQSFSVAGGTGPDYLLIDAPTVPLGAVAVALSTADESAVVVQNAVASGFDASARTIQVNDGTLASTGPNPVRLAAGGSAVFGALTVFDGTIRTDDGAIILSGDGTGLPGIQGVLLSGATVRTTGVGGISITGAGGTGSFGVGVVVANGSRVEAVGIGTVTLSGTGGGSAGGQVNGGVFVGGKGSAVASAGGLITLTGTGGLGTDSAGVSVQDTGRVAGGGDVLIVADRVNIDADPDSNPPGTFTPGLGFVTAVGAVTVRPLSAGLAIDLGTDDAPGVLGLTAGELDQITAARIVVGDGTAGNLTVTAPVAPAGTGQLELVTGGAITTAAGATVTVERVALTAGTGVGTFDDPLTVAVDNLEGTTAAGNFVVTDIDGLTVGGVTTALDGVSAPLNVELTTGAGGTLTITEAITSGGADVVLTADDVAITAAVSAPAAIGAVRLFTVTPGRPIDVGTDTAGSLGVTAAELLRLTAGRLVRIGGPGSGDLTVSAPVSAAAGVPALVFATSANIAQAADAPVTAAGFAVDLLSPATTATLTAANRVTVFAGRAFPDLGGVLPTGDITFVNAAALTIGTVSTVVGLRGRDVAVSTTAGDLTLAGPATAEGTLLLGVATAGGGGTATVPGGLLNTAGGTTVFGGAGSDTFNLSGSAKSAITVNGNGPTVPAVPGDVLNFTPGGVTLGIAPSLTGGTLTDGALKPVTFAGIETFNLTAAAGAVTVEGSPAAADFVKLFRDATDGLTYFQYSADNGAVFGTRFRVTWSPFVFNGNGGTTAVGGKTRVDTLRVAYTGGDPLTAISGVTFTGVPASGGLLSVQGKAAVAKRDARYVPDATTTGNGTVTLTDPAGLAAPKVITFTGLSPVDLFGLNVVTVALPNADDQLTVATGFDFATNAKPALIVSGTSGGVVIEPAAIWASAKLVIDTAAAPGVDGNDTVTIEAADNNHLITNLSVVTGAGADLVTVGVTSGVVVAGSFDVQSVDLAVNKNVSATTGTVTLTNSGTLTLGAVTVSGGSGVTQAGGGPVVLAGDATLTSAAGDVSVGSAVGTATDGANTLTATAPAGTVTLAGSVGGAGPLSLGKLVVAGTAINLGGADYKTNGDQTYTGATTVSAATVGFASAAGGTSFNGTLDSAPLPAVASAVTVASKNGLLLGGAVGSNAPLASLAVNPGPTTIAGGSVTTDGKQSYAGPVVLAADTTLTGTAAAFLSTLDSDATPRTLTVTGNADFGGAVGTSRLASLLVTGGTRVAGGVVRTTSTGGTGQQTYTGPVVVDGLAAMFDAEAGVVRFDATLDGTDPGETAVTVNSTGDTTFGGAVGVTVPLGSLTTNAGGQTRLSGPTVRTTGDQTFNDPVVLLADTTFETKLLADLTKVGTGKVTFAATLDGPGGAVVTTDGDTTFAGVVGGVTPLAGLRTDGSAAPGTTFVSGDVTTTGPQLYADDVVLKATVLFRSGPAGPVTFAGKLDALAAGAQGATVRTAAATTFSKAVGTTPLGFLVTDGGGTTFVNGGTVKTTGGQVYADAVRLGASAVFTSTDPLPTGGISFDATLDSAAPRGTAGATINTPGGGVTRFRGAVGGAADGGLAFLTTDAAGRTEVNGGLVQTTGGQTFNDPVSAPGDVTFQTVNAVTGLVPGTGDISFLDPGPTSLTAGGVVTICTLGTITFEGTVTAAGLRLECAGGTIDLNGGSVVTLGGEQFYASDVVLTEDATLIADAVTFGGRVDADLVAPWALNVLAGVTFNGQVGGADAAGIAGRQPLGRLDVTGPATVAGGLVRTTDSPAVGPGSGSQNYGGPVTVVADTAFVADGKATGRINFFSTLDSAPAGFAVRVTTAGLTVFGGAVGGTGPLGGLITDGGGLALVQGGLVRTVGTASRSGSQLYRDAVQVAAETDFEVIPSVGGQAVTFDSTLDSAGGTPAVRVVAGGDVTFTGAVGKAAALGSLAVPGVVGLPDNGGRTFVNGKDVVTTGGQQYGQRVVLGADTTFTAGGDVRFDNRLDAAVSGGAFARINAPGVSRFKGQVGLDGPLSSFTTDEFGGVEFAGALVRTTGDQTYLDPAVVTVDTAFVSELGGAIRFDQTLLGPATAVVTTTGPITFQGAVGGVTSPDTLQAGPGPIAVNGGAVGARAEIRFDGPVTVGADTRFGAASLAGAGPGVFFNSTLTGLGRAVAVLTSGTSLFGGDVTVGSLTTDGPRRFSDGGATGIAAANVTATGPVEFGDGVVLLAPAVTVGGSSVTFARAVVSFDATGLGRGTAAMTVNSPGRTTFGGEVRIGSLATDAGGTTAVGGGLIDTLGTQVYGDPVAVGTATRFRSSGAGAAGLIAFGKTLTGEFDVVVETAGVTVFNGGVNVGSLATDAPGTTRVNGGGVQTTGDQRFDDPVFVGDQSATFQSTGSGSLKFNQTLDGPQAATVKTQGTAEFVGAVGKSVPLAALTLDSATTRVTGRLLKTTGGVTQTSGAVVADVLDLQGGGTTTIDLAANQISRLTTALDDGTVRLSTGGGLELTGPGVSLAGGGFVRIRTGNGFAAEDGVAVNIPDGQLVVYPRLAPPADQAANLRQDAAVRFFAPATAKQVVLGRPTSPPDDLPPIALPSEADKTGFRLEANTEADQFFVRPSAAAPIFVYGNDPRTPPGDSLQPDFNGKAVVDFRYDGQDGFYDVADRRRLTFSSIESLTGLSQTGFVVQTGEPRDKSGATSQQYAVRLVRTQNGTPLTGGLQGARLPENPFVVSPALVNPFAPTQSPRIAFGDFNGDNLPDLVLANGPGTPPLVTVIDGKALDPAFNDGGELSDIATLADGKRILAQFYAYDPGFQGGVNVAVGRLGPAGELTITTGADDGGGPRVRTFGLVSTSKFLADGSTLNKYYNPNSPTPLAPLQVSNPFGNFFAYEPSFTGGVRVAVADVTGDGADDLILAPGAGGGPRVRVFDGAQLRGNEVQTKADELTGFTPAYADFFTVEPTFRGGLYLAAGFYRGPATTGAKADIIVGAAGGGGPRVMIFDGSTLTRGTTAPAQLANFFAFTDNEQNDPLFGRANYFTGVGGVSFGARAASGYLDVLVSTGRGPQVKVRRFAGGPRADLSVPTTATDIQDLTDPTLKRFGDQPLLEPIPRLRDGNNRLLAPERLNYGGTVGGFEVG